MRNDRFASAAGWATSACLLLLLLAVAGCGESSAPASQATSPQPSASPTGTPLHVGTADEVVTTIAGIQPGMMEDADVVAMYGPGVVYGEIPWARYYTDPSHQITLMSGWHTDHTVVVVMLTEGTALPPGVDPALTVTSLSVPVEIDKDISLGMTPAEAVNRLGQPQRESRSDGGDALTLSYEVWADDPSEAGWISYNAVLEFGSGRLHSIAVYSGD